MGRVDYKEYLQSPEWRSTRKRALERAGGRCQVCNKVDRLDVHHRTYVRLGRERPGDLTVLCRSCHDMYHAKGKLASPPKRARQPMVFGPEGVVAWFCLHRPELVAGVLDQLPVDLFVDPAARSVVVDMACGGDGWTGDVKEEWADTDHSLSDGCFDEAVERLTQRPLMVKIQRARALLDDAIQGDDEGRVNGLLERLTELNEQKRSISSGWSSFHPPGWRDR